jgi:hypothetical protein
MNVTFLTPLKLEKLEGDRWSVDKPFVVEFDTNDLFLASVPWVYSTGPGCVLTVPAGFSNDMASVPRLPLAYWLAGDTAHRSGVVHDYLYSVKAPRDLADEVFMACMKAEGVPGWRRSLMYAAVRAFGGNYYQEREPHQEAPDTPA